MMLRPVPSAKFNGGSVRSLEQNGLVGSLLIQSKTFLSAGENNFSLCSKLSLSLVCRSCHLLNWFKYYAFLLINFDNEEIGVFFTKLYSQRFRNNNDLGAIGHICFGGCNYFLHYG